MKPFEKLPKKKPSKLNYTYVEKDNKILDQLATDLRKEETETAEVLEFHRNKINKFKESFKENEIPQQEVNEIPQIKKSSFCMDSANERYKNNKSILENRNIAYENIHKKLIQDNEASKKEISFWKQEHDNKKAQLEEHKKIADEKYSYLKEKYELNEKKIQLYEESYSYKIGKFFANIWDDTLIVSKVIFLGGTCAMICYGFIKYALPSISSLMRISSGSEPPEPPSSTTVIEDSIPREGFWKKFFKMLIEYIEQNRETGKILIEEKILKK
jgi:hypothetical protein